MYHNSIGWLFVDQLCNTVLLAATQILPYFSIDNAHVIYTKRSKFVKNKHARYTLEYFSTDNARVIYTKGLNS
jgi:hypothetical protein